MPEIPDLEGYKAYFNGRLPGLSVSSVEMPIAWMVRTGREDFQERVPGQTFGRVERHGKLLLFWFRGGDCLVAHAMLAGRYQYCEPKTRRRPMTALVLELDNGLQLRYADERRMGRLYLVHDNRFAGTVARWEEMGPDVMSAGLTEEEFLRRMKTMRGMIKNIITNERVIAGIGNAYADEVLWEVRIHPFRKRTDIPDGRLRELYQGIRRVMGWASPIVIERMETEDLPSKMYRDHLRVHGRADQDCPRCGHHITAITSGGRETDFCRGCQE